MFWVLYHEFIIKTYFQRHRPVTAGKQSGFSFPSSHSFSSGLLIIVCLFFSIPWTPLIIALAIINILNRPAVGVHYIADVVAGTFLGLLAGLGWLFILKIAKVTLL
ncbi:phosphatase PAP2 family protein [bacterium]|nr:phosphatase PAP2 family protein [bacterium]